MNGLKSRLHDLSPTIKKILEIAGAAGASIGIIHQNEVVQLAGFGHRDISKALVPDEHTIYHIASLSKSFTAASLGILVHDKKLSLDQVVSSILPSFSHPDESLQSHATVLDFLSHRTGLATKQSLWQQDGQELLLQKSDIMDIVSYLEVVKPLGSWYNYNNWGYDVASKIIEEISEQDWGTFVSEQVLQPLHLERTFVGTTIPEENYAMGYMPGLDGTLTPVGRPFIANGTVQQGANAIKTTVHDLLHYYQATLRAWKHESEHGHSDPESPLKGIKDLLTGHICMDPDSEHKQEYGAGWAIVELPSPVGAIGTNGMFVPEMPILGKGAGKKKLWYHNGSLVGFFSSVHVIPETDTIVVVLVNSIPKNDAADWIGQLLVEAILDNPDKNDYLALADESAKGYENMWDQLADEMKKSKGNATNDRPLHEYAGKYFNKPKDWFIEVEIHNGGLQFSFQGRSSQKHRLHSHSADTFSWPVTESESRHLGRWPDLDASTYIFNFETDDKSSITTLRWVHDPDVPNGESFTKEASSKVEQIQLDRENTPDGPIRPEL